MIQFHADGSVTQEAGREIPTDRWLASPIVSGTITMFWWGDVFGEDIGKSMVQDGKGHDPYNHVGTEVVMLVLGISDIPEITLGGML